MIKLLAPTTVESAETDESIIIELSLDVFGALATAVQAAFDDESSLPPDLRQPAREAWAFFTRGEPTR